MKIVVAFCIALLSACHSESPSPAATIVASSAPLSSAPWLFWEGELRVHLLQYCHQSWQTASHDVWEHAQLPLPCDTQQTLHIQSQTVNSELDEKTSHWLALPSAEPKRWRAVLQKEGVIGKNDQWLWNNGRVVLIAGLFTANNSVEDLLFWHQLDQQARRQGGAVVVLLNHRDIALMGGDEQVNASIRHDADQLQLSVADLFGLNSEWGRWLRQQKLVLKWNDTLFSNVQWSSLDLDSFADPEAINHVLRLGLHTRFRRYTDPAVTRVFEQTEASTTVITAQAWQAIQTQWLVNQWITVQESQANGVYSVKQPLLWQHGETRVISH